MYCFYLDCNEGFEKQKFWIESDQNSRPFMTLPIYKCLTLCSICQYQQCSPFSPELPHMSLETFTQFLYVNGAKIFLESSAWEVMCGQGRLRSEQKLHDRSDQGWQWGGQIWHKSKLNLQIWTGGTNVGKINKQANVLMLTVGTNVGLFNQLKHVKYGQVRLDYSSVRLVRLGFDNLAQLKYPPFAVICSSDYCYICL